MKIRTIDHQEKIIIEIVAWVLVFGAACFFTMAIL